jgi:hypothetical protein
MRIARERMSRRIVTSAGKSNTSRSTSRYVSSVIGNAGKRSATPISCCARNRCAHSGVR